MKTRVLCVGKLKENYLVEAIAEYSKRLTPYCKLEIIEVPEEKLPDSAGSAICDKIKQRECERILTRVNDSDFVITLDIDGQQLSSEEFSKTYAQIMNAGNSSIVFVIGGSLGLHANIRQIRNMSLSFSNMTFPHQLMRLILLEQVYRAWKIIKNEPYHK